MVGSPACGIELEWKFSGFNRGLLTPFFEQPGGGGF
jgi:hypothetical protein